MPITCPHCGKEILSEHEKKRSERPAKYDVGDRIIHLSDVPRRPIQKNKLLLGKITKVWPFWTKAGEHTYSVDWDDKSLQLPESTSSEHGEYLESELVYHP